MTTSVDHNTTSKAGLLTPAAGLHLLSIGFFDPASVHTPRLKSSAQNAPKDKTLKLLLE
jgi:hypothetical protein